MLPTYGKINASPTKDFFVSMLTRDITLEDAILDLLDNCVDGILRNDLTETGDAPYKKRYSHIVIEADHFSITDNCGGIPWAQKDYAFRMGRPPDSKKPDLPTVGVYGIGMKRAIFKMGRECSIQTRNGKDAYDVEIDGAWLADEKTWELTAVPSKEKPKEEGTTIVIGKLLPGVKEEFGKRLEEFHKRLETAIDTHYSAIIEKGFAVTINKVPVRGHPVRLAFAQGTKAGMRPYIFTTEHEGVKVFLAVGFTRPIPDEDEQREDTENPKYKSDRAGWTVVCNDRVVLYSDKSERTGWGISGVPRFHPQFIAISGVVEFVSNDASKLPTVTTKRGLDMGSILYLHVREKMIEGMKLFTDYTYHWKKEIESAKAQIKDAPLVNLAELKAYSVKHRGEFSKSKRTIGGTYFQPTLPRPKRETVTARRISFSRPADEIATVAEFLFGEDADKEPSEIGEKCFDNTLKRAKQK
jgi:hypothetical protein